MELLQRIKKKVIYTTNGIGRRYPRIPIPPELCKSDECYIEEQPNGDLLIRFV